MYVWCRRLVELGEGDRLAGFPALFVMDVDVTVSWASNVPTAAPPSPMDGWNRTVFVALITGGSMMWKGGVWNSLQSRRIALTRIGFGIKPTRWKDSQGSSSLTLDQSRHRFCPVGMCWQGRMGGGGL